ncbi:unnamed protein product, partial [Adineta steineri]
MFKSQLKQHSVNNSSISTELKNKLDQKQIQAIITDARTFGDFSRQGMREFLAIAIPGYTPLHRNTVRKRLRGLYIEHRNKLRKLLLNVSDISLTTDIWKDSRNRYFIAVTGHYYDKNYNFISLILNFRLIRGRHFANRLARFIKEEIVFLGIEQEVRSITTDNAPNIVKAISDLGIIHHSCMAHNLHLIIKTTLFPTPKK